MGHFILDHNAYVSWWIFTHLVSKEREERMLYRGVRKFTTIHQLCVYTTW